MLNFEEKFRVYVRELLMEVPLDDFGYVTPQKKDASVVVKGELADYFKDIPQTVNVYIAHTDDLNWARKIPGEISSKLPDHVQGRGTTQITDVSGVAKSYPQLARELDGSVINLLYVYSKSYLTSDRFVVDVSPHYIAHDLHHIFELQRDKGDVPERLQDRFKETLTAYLNELLMYVLGPNSDEYKAASKALDYFGRRFGVNEAEGRKFYSEIFPGYDFVSGESDLLADAFAAFLKSGKEIKLGIPSSWKGATGSYANRVDREIQIPNNAVTQDIATDHSKDLQHLLEDLMEPLVGKVGIFNVFEVGSTDRKRAEAESKGMARKKYPELFDYFDEQDAKFLEFSGFATGRPLVVEFPHPDPGKDIWKVEDYAAFKPDVVAKLGSLGFDITEASTGFGFEDDEGIKLYLLPLKTVNESTIPAGIVKEELLRRHVRAVLLEKSLTGRKLEKVAEAIANEVVEYLFDSNLRNAYATQGQLKFDVDVKLPKKVTWLRNVSVELIPHDDFNSSAAYQFDLDADDEQRKTSDILLQLRMPTDYEDEEINRFKIEIESDLRHELEHSGQPTDVLMDVQKKVPDSEIWKTLQRADDYYTSEAEVPSYVAGLVIKSKRKGIPAADVIDKELYNIYATGLGEGYSEADLDPLMKKIRDIWQYYLMMRWPEQDWPIELRDILESITLDLEHGDVILTGKFKNKRTIVKKIGQDEYGHPTINGKSILRFKVEKFLPKDNWSKKSREELEEAMHQHATINDRFPVLHEYIRELLKEGAKSSQNLYKLGRPS